MPDTYDAATRSAVMRRVKGRDTTPEVAVRRMLHRMGYRFRLRRDDLPGKPDIVLPKRKAVIFVHGCFWHGHAGCAAAARPASNTDYWNRKLDRNMERDRKNAAALEHAGWRVLVVWECSLKNASALQDQLRAFLS